MSEKGAGILSHLGGVVVIPARRTRRSRKVRESVEAHIAAQRNRIERSFNRLENARRDATCNDKTADSYCGFVQIISIRLWIRDFVNTHQARIVLESHFLSAPHRASTLRTKESRRGRSPRRGADGRAQVRR